MKNRLISVLAGIVTGWLTVFIGEVILQQAFPAPADLNFTDKAAMTNYMQSLPNSFFVFLLIIWAASAFFGEMVTGKIAKDNWKKACLITGLILLAGNIANFISIPHPLWVNFISVAMYIPLTRIGGWMVNRSSPQV